MNPNPLRDDVRAVMEQGGIVDRGDRGLIEITGADRAAWLNNLVTNIVKTLGPGEGNYAFCANVKGRIVFDLNMLVGARAIWADIDARWIAAALGWFDRYLITEDVTLADRSQEVRRIAVVGPAAAKVCAHFGFGNLSPQAWLQHSAHDVAGAEVTAVRHDFLGILGADFIVTGDAAAAAVADIRAAARTTGAVEAARETCETLRIEAGIPASIADLDDEVVVPEAGQLERAVSYQKGCYLGQEVIERMRSRGGLARRLVRLRVASAALPAKGDAVQRDGATVGRITSSAWSSRGKDAVALGYMKVAHAAPGTPVTVATAEGPATGAVLPGGIGG